MRPFDLGAWLIVGFLAVAFATIIFIPAPAQPQSWRWIIAVGDSLESEIACQLDLTSLSLIVQKSRLQCIKVVTVP